MIDASDTAIARRFTRRVAFFEAPAVAERLEEMARDAGGSMAAEIRRSIRYWISVNGPASEDR